MRKMRYQNAADAEKVNLFHADIVEEFVLFQDANRDNYDWWSFINQESDLDCALGFAKFYCPDIVLVDDCFFLKDRFFADIYEDWKKDLGNDVTAIEKMVNLYSLEDIFHINTEITPHYAEKFEALGRCLKFFWETSFRARFPERNVAVDVFREYEDETCITVYQKRNL